MWDPLEGMGVYKGMFLGLLKASSLRKEQQQLLEEKASILKLAGVLSLSLLFSSC